MELSVIVPCLNEEANVPELAARVGDVFKVGGIDGGLNTMLNTAFGMSLKDNKSGFILCAREVMEDLLSYRGTYFYWQSFIMVAAHAKGYTYKEVETLFENRRAGKSFLDNAHVKAVA